MELTGKYSIFIVFLGSVSHIWTLKFFCATLIASIKYICYVTFL